MDIISKRNGKKLVLGCLCAAALSACGTVSQPAAPVEQAGVPAQTAPYDPNPYGAETPYTPQQPYSPPPAPVDSSGGYAAAQSAYIPSSAPVDPNATRHTVIYGDTVYNLSKRYGISQSQLRAWNNLPDNNIRIGSVLYVKNPGGRSRAPVQTAAAAPAAAGNIAPYVPPPAEVQKPVTPPSVPGTAMLPPGGVPEAAGTRSVGGITWARPTSGSVLSGYGGNSKGLDFGGEAGQPVYAAADGTVAYSGSGLRGYGNLVIIQHNDTYLSAYGNNQSISVREGQAVKRGQEIAKMGNSDASRTQLHFEIRENGEPQDPSRFLPR